MDLGEVGEGGGAAQEGEEVVERWGGMDRVLLRGRGRWERRGGEGTKREVVSKTHRIAPSILLSRKRRRARTRER